MDNNKNIVLIGLMGAGKTTVGKKLSELLDYKFIDIDSEIEERENIKISKIFEDKGEAYFRQLEANLIKEFSQKEKLIISTGGGAFQDQVNRITLKEGGSVFYLQAPTPILFKRMLNEIDNRPMLHTENPEQRLQDLLNLREPNYNEADFIINTENKEPDEIANEIIEML